MAPIHTHGLLATSTLIVSRSDHGGEVVPAGTQEEVCDHYCVNFVESGEFGLGVERREWRLRRGDAFAWHPSTVQRYTHFQDVPADVCLTVRFRGEAEREIERSGHLREAARVPALRPTNRLSFLRFRLDRILQARDALALEEWSAALLEAIADPGQGDRLCREGRLGRCAGKIELARRRLLTDFGEQHSLATLAAAAGMSPFHFARVFRTLVGTPPHRFLRDLRLDRARDMLRDGEKVTTTCYAVGFGNLSHFIRSFQRRFGSAPSQIRKKAQAAVEPRAS